MPLESKKPVSVDRLFVDYLAKIRPANDCKFRTESFVFGSRQISLQLPIQAPHFTLVNWAFTESVLFLLLASTEWAIDRLPNGIIAVAVDRGSDVYETVFWHTATPELWASMGIDPS